MSRYKLSEVRLPGVDMLRQQNARVRGSLAELRGNNEFLDRVVDNAESKSQLSGSPGEIAV